MARAEKAILTNMCMVEDGDFILVQDRMNPDWPGLTFPGGHIEHDESFHDAVIREVWEETGLTIQNPLLCGSKQFQTNNDERYVVFFYKTDKFSGELKSSDEGKVFWIKKEELANYELANDFLEMYKIFVDDKLSEFYYRQDGDDWQIEIY